MKLDYNVQMRQNITKEALGNVWQNPVTAEAAAKCQDGELWRTCVKLTWRKYRGMSFKWLLENDVGWVVWIVSTCIVEGEKNPLMSWQKQTLLDLVRQFSLVMVHVDKRLKRNQVMATWIFSSLLQSTFLTKLIFIYSKLWSVPWFPYR